MPRSCSNSYLTRADYDPEGDAHPSGSDSEDSDNERAGTEHYVSMGKSKIRQKEGASLGPQYRGARVTREALEDDDEDEEDESDEDAEYDDPENANLEADTADASDSEIDSDDALAESDAERLEGFAFRGSSKPAKQGRAKRAKAADYMSSSDEGEGSRGGVDVEDDEDEDEEEDDEMSGVELGESDEDDDVDDGLDDLVDGGADSDSDSEMEGQDDDEASQDDAEESDSGDDEQTGTKKGQDARPMMAALSNRADIDKGTAIQQQRKIYDGLLNLRIRLQKALVAANTFPALESDAEPTAEPYEAAEEAAVKLLNTISMLKDNVGTSRAGEKRKRDLDVSMSSEDMWRQLQEQDQSAAKTREDTLEKWSRKVQTVNLSAAKGLGARNKTLIDVLQEQLTTSGDRLAKRTRVPRSCAPAQAAKKVAEDEDIYDDADFYQLLLKDLVDQRTVETTSAQTGAVPSVMLTAAKEAKVRKNVDRKASKGRKMRFTVHEKIQNFMAPEDRRSWEQAAVDRFFGALFGRKLELDERESEDEDEDTLRAEEDGLRLFRN